MSRICPPDGACVEVDVGRNRYKMNRGAFDVENKAHEKALLEIGGFRPTGGPFSSRQAGYRCPECHFGTWFKTCGRCGAACERES